MSNQNKVEQDLEDEDIILFLNDEKCLICLEVYKVDELISMKTCNAIFCKVCFNEYLKTEIERGEVSILCPNSNCKKVLSASLIITKTAVDKELQKKYFKFSFEKFRKEKGDKYFQCPTPDCMYGVELENNCQKDNKFICKVCGKNYCFSCKTEYKAEHKCVVNDGEVEFKDYLKKNKLTKPCPGCKVLIEKNDGCNHMTCKNCKHEFCFVCLKAGTEVHRECKEKEPVQEENVAAVRLERIERVEENPVPTRLNERQFNYNAFNTNIDYFSDIFNERNVLYARSTNYARQDYNESFYQNFSRVQKSSKRPVKSDNKTTSNIISISSSGPLKKDGTPDMRFAENKVSSSNNDKYSFSQLLNQSSSGPTKKDGTLDMRYASNKSSSVYDSSSYYSTKESSFSGPTKSDGTPDMRYASNKSSSYYSYPKVSKYFKIKLRLQLLPD